MYKYHRDIPNNKWNVFDPYGNFLIAYDDVEDAKEFCRIYNNEELDAKRTEERCV